jgi:hypothetical protein
MQMDFESIEQIGDHGFQGFRTVSWLQTSACREVPDEQGVYLVLRPERTHPTFLQQSTGGHFKGKDPAVPPAKLAGKWANGPIVVYIGKAGRSEGRATLRSRLLAYMRFGQGEPVGHWGGRYIWQLAGSGDLIVCWKPTPEEEPAEVETRLIRDFKAKYGRLPFANLRH